MQNSPILEACVETLEQAVAAEKNGADRIELCSNLSAGGLTPPIDLLLSTHNAIELPIMAMARPRAGNFVCSKREMESVKKAIALFKEVGIKGVVFGFLTEKNEVDVEATTTCAQFAHPLEVTFHKAVDDTPDLIKSIHILKRIPGIKRVLTSGGMATALEGGENIVEMQRAAGKGLTVIAAGKVTKDNLEHLHKLVNCREYHGRRIVF